MDIANTLWKNLGEYVENLDRLKERNVGWISSDCERRDRCADRRKGDQP